MAVALGKEVTVATDSDPTKRSSVSQHDASDFEVSDGHQLDKPAQDMTADQYPHGLKLILLASASLVSVFLIALDQVNTQSANAEAV